MITGLTAGKRGTIDLAGYNIPIYAFTGVFSSLANISVIFMTVFCGKKGYITSVAILIIQLPIIGVDIFARRNPTSLPGMFGNLLTIVAVTVVFLYNK